MIEVSIHCSNVVTLRQSLKSFKMGAGHWKDQALNKLLELSAPSYPQPLKRRARDLLNNQSYLCGKTSIKSLKQQGLSASRVMHAWTCQVDGVPRSMDTEAPVHRTLHAYPSGSTFVSYKVNWQT